jgi:hypothetical protein
MCLFNLIFIIPSVLAVTYTPDKLFAALDTNYDDIITPGELKLAIKKISVIQSYEPCVCFDCNGNLFHYAEVCDIYDNSGCSNADTAKYACYTTNDRKCNCNLYSTNHYICKIPLTHSFTNYTPNSGMSYSVNLKSKTSKINEKKTTAYKQSDTAYKQSDTAYYRGRSSAWNDVANAIISYIWVDAGISVFSAVLDAKDPY